jgi:hypothetical protein
MDEIKTKMTGRIYGYAIQMRWWGSQNWHCKCQDEECKSQNWQCKFSSLDTKCFVFCYDSETHILALSGDTESPIAGHFVGKLNPSLAQHAVH